MAVAPSESVRVAFTGFGSARLPIEEFGGLGHVLYRNGKLYVLNGLNGRLYTADGSSYKTKDAPVPASSL